MTIEAGTRIGRYEIQDLLGAGGMGEVYLVVDTQLDREVALKVLAAEVASDQQRLHRFLQEARAASKLKSAHAAHVYDVGEAGGTHFIAMEYVEGRPLDRVIDGRPVETAEVVRIGAQIAEALEEAHSRGVTHRDIKPSNVIVTPRGQVKVLDFGLAKLAPRPPAARAAEATTHVRTDPGAVMGTFAYMSPEQALARDTVDHRTDIWSLGVVLYEMLTGRLPFGGRSANETINRIVHEQPEAIARYNYDVPAELEVVVRKALRKNADERYQSARDILIDLRAVARDLELTALREHLAPPNASPKASDEQATVLLPPPPSTGTQAPQTATEEVSPAAPTASASTPVWSGRSRRAVYTTLGLILVGGAGLGIALYKSAHRASQPDSPRPEARQMKISRLTSGGALGAASISPDGAYVVYASSEGDRGTLLIRQLATGSTREIVAPAEDLNVSATTFSPDGQLVYYVARARGEQPRDLYQVPAIGGREPKKILTDVHSSAAFAPDGRRFAFLRYVAATGDTHLMVADTEGGEPRRLATRGGDDWFSPAAGSWSPDGKIIAWAVGSETGGSHATIAAVPAETGELVPLTPRRWTGRVGRVAWLGDGTGMIITAAERVNGPGQLWHVSYPEGAARRITNDLSDYGSLGVTADGQTLVASLRTSSSQIWTLGVGEPAARARKITSGGSDGQAGAAWTPDGRIVYVAQAGDDQDLWVMNADGSGAKQLTSDSHAEFGPVVTPDGRRIVFMSDRAGNFNLWRVDIDGGNLKQLTGGSEDASPSVSPDGRWVAFDSSRSGKYSLWKVSIDGGEPVRLTEAATSTPVYSPDGKSILCDYVDETTTPARTRTAIIPAEGGPPSRVFDLPPESGHLWTWARDGGTILYLRRSGITTNVWRYPLDGGRPAPVTDFGADDTYVFALSPDSRRLALARGTTSASLVLIKDFR